MMTWEPQLAFGTMVVVEASTRGHWYTALSPVRHAPTPRVIAVSPVCVVRSRLARQGFPPWQRCDVGLLPGWSPDLGVTVVHMVSSSSSPDLHELRALRGPLWCRQSDGEKRWKCG